MNIPTILRDWFQFDEEMQAFFIKLGIQVSVFLLFVFISLLVGQYTPLVIKFMVRRIASHQVFEAYIRLIEPIEHLFKIVGTLVLLSLCLAFLQDYKAFYNFFKVLMDFGIVFSTAWLASRLFRQLVRIYGIDLIRKLGLEVDEMLLVFETIANVLIGFVAVVTFAQSQNVNLIGLLTGVGIGGIAIAFAAQKTLEQLLGTIVLYLDRPFIPGDYIRVGLNPHTEPEYGRVESIGLRSTKIRTAAKSTLVIVPNSVMANIDIENITRGKKVMVLLYLDFSQRLEDREQALVEQVVKESTDELFGIDPGSTKIKLFDPDDRPGSRARVTFFILGSSENSIQLRKRLLELANQTMSKKLETFNIQFTTEDPTVYVESPVTL